MLKARVVALSSAKVVKFLSIAVGLMAGPGILFVLPYVLAAGDYAAFATMLAVSQLISMVGTVGLEVACPREGVNLRHASAYTVLTTALAAGAVYFFASKLTLWEFGLAALAASANTLSTVFQSYLVFSGRSLSYGLAGGGRALVTLLTLSLFLRAGLGAAAAWSVAALIGLGLVLVLMLGERKAVATLIRPDPPGLRALVRLSLPLALIYGAATMPFILDRIVAQGHLPALQFAQYAVAVTWAVPLIYVGNIFQQFMISEARFAEPARLARYAGALFGLAALYVLGVLFLLQCGLTIPYFDGERAFLLVWGPIVAVYTVYATLMFPAAAVVQKLFSSAEIVRLGWTTALAVALAGALVALCVARAGTGLGIYLPVVVIVGFAIAAAIPRVIFVCRHISTKQTPSPQV